MNGTITKNAAIETIPLTYCVIWLIASLKDMEIIFWTLFESSPLLKSGKTPNIFFSRSLSSWFKEKSFNDAKPDPFEGKILG